MTEREIKLRIIENADAIAKEIHRGKDIYITKSGTDVVVKKLNVQKVW